MFKKEREMITINDVEKIVIDSFCTRCLPCSHYVTITLKDGRKSSALSSVDICTLVNELALERINPNPTMDSSAQHLVAQAKIEHFSEYIQLSKDPISCKFIKLQSSEAILNRIFPENFIQKEVWDENEDEEFTS